MKVVTVASALLLCALGFGCGGGSSLEYRRGLAGGDRAHAAGRHAEAAAEYERTAALSKKPRDRGRAESLAAAAYLKAGQVDRARAIFEKLAKANPENQYSAGAAFKLAELQAAEDPALGQRAFEQMFAAFPSNGLARRALTLALATREEKDGVAAVIQYLDELSRGPLRKSELGQNIAYSLAEASFRAGRTEGAYAQYVAVANEWPYPFGAFFDDALHKAAQIDVGRNEFARAIVLLERLLAEHETSSLMGSYHRPRMNAAALQVARIYEEKLRNRDKAREAYGRIYSLFTTGALRDDALWQQARLYREDGDPSSACGRLSKLVNEFPDSRYVPCAESTCNVTRSKKSHAPKECRDYLKRGYLPDLARPPFGDDGAVVPPGGAPAAAID